jgi:hypothetical protein
VLAVNSVGRGPPSVPVNATTGETGSNPLGIFPLLRVDVEVQNVERQKAKNIESVEIISLYLTAPSPAR